MNENESEQVASLFEEIVSKLAYYNDLAIKTELKKYESFELIKKIRDDSYSIITVKDLNQIVGFCFSRFDDYIIWLEWFGIKSTYRKTGISNLIIKKLVESTIERGCHKIWCDCRTTNLISKKVLISNDFIPIATVNNHWYNQDFILWHKLLT